MSFPNVMLPGGPMAYADVGARARSSRAVGWADLQWIRDVWGGPIVVKGVHTADDARRAVDAGADGDRRVQPRRPAAGRRGGDDPRAAGSGRRRSATGPRCCFDGGIRRGSDIVKALVPRRARRADRTRVVLRARAAGGPGVTRAIDILRADLLRTLTLLGCGSAAALDRSFIDVPIGWPIRSAVICSTRS